MKKNRRCKYCKTIFTDIEGRVFSNHVRWCSCNPNDAYKNPQMSFILSQRMIRINQSVKIENRKLTEEQLDSLGYNFIEKLKVMSLSKIQEELKTRGIVHPKIAIQILKSKYSKEFLREVYRKRTNRKISKGVSIAMKEGRLNPFSWRNYLHGTHVTWDGRKVFYRSSYELNYIQELDENQIIYDMESLRIYYWDSQLNKIRIAIPDFYLSESNTIVEIKSEYFLDEQRMKDRKVAYENLGYNFMLFVDNERRLL